jgi:hypothetical protein
VSVLRRENTGKKNHIKFFSSGGQGDGHWPAHTAAGVWIPEHTMEGQWMCRGEGTLFKMRMMGWARGYLDRS